MSPMPDRRHGMAGAAVSWLRRRLLWRRPSSFWQALSGAFGGVHARLCQRVRTRRVLDRFRWL
jgi:hypothetical protein